MPGGAQELLPETTYGTALCGSEGEEDGKKDKKRSEEEEG